MRLLIMLAAFFALAAAPGVAAQPPTPEPSPPVVNGITIDGCSLEYNSRTHVAAKLHVDFINLNELPVTNIRFRIRAGFQTFPVMDVGTFAPNLKIHHDLDPPEMPVAVVQGAPDSGGGLYCSVDAFTLSDGYTWISQELQTELEQQKKP